MHNDTDITDLIPLGLKEAAYTAWLASADGHGGIARVLSARRDRWLVAGRFGPGHQSSADDAHLRGLPSPTALATLSGKLLAAGDLPVTGDWVALKPASAQGSLPVIEAILPRASFFSRKAAGPTSESQPIVSNIDAALCVMAAGQNFNLRRLERYLSLSWESGAQPVIVITKLDLAEDRASLEADIDGIAFGLPRAFCSSKTGEGLEAVAALLKPASTAVLLGSSGCGKSSLLNALAGESLMETRAISDAVQKGRHTTTGRELFALPSGALVIDTPGMRELGLNCGDASVEAAFPELEELAAACRFSDCSHGSEPGCAVREALEAGRIDQARLDSWDKLRKEAAYERRRSDAAAARAEEARWKAIAKSHRGMAGHDHKARRIGF